MSLSTGNVAPAVWLDSDAGPPNDVDIAIITPNPSRTITKAVRGLGDVTDIYDLAKLGAGHNVMLSGAVTGAHKFYITGYLVIYKISHAGQFYCFKNLFEIAGVPSPSLFGFFGAFVPVPKGGDSGSWICCPDPNGDLAVCGMLLAGDNSRGYACFTDQMLEWADTKASLTLSVM